MDAEKPHVWATALDAMKYENAEDYSSGSKSCNIAKCTLYKQGCKVAWGDDNRVTMDSTAPFKVTALRNDPEGYSVAFCIKCQNYVGPESVKDSAGQVISRDDIVFKQAEKGALTKTIIIVVVIVVVLCGASIAYNQCCGKMEDARDDGIDRNIDNAVDRAVDRAERRLDDKLDDIEEQQKNLEWQQQQLNQQ